MTQVTWVGRFDGHAAYHQINRELSRHLNREGWTVIRWLHHDGPDITSLTPFLLSCTYPPQPLQRRHEHNLILSTWEFAGEYGVPRSFLEVFRQYDLVLAMCEQAQEAFSAALPEVPVLALPLGVDTVDYHPRGAYFDVGELLGRDRRDDETILLYVGGTDPRHGYQRLPAIMEALGENYTLLAKVGSYYPTDGMAHPRIHLITHDYDSLSLLYRTADLLLHPALAVAPSLPVMEALCCGLPVVSAALPAVLETRERALRGGMPRQAMRLAACRLAPAGLHHIHPDCDPYWWDYEIDDLVQAVREMADDLPADRTWGNAVGEELDWGHTAENLADLLRRMR
ncbi:MAG: hypothetical protein IT326_00550 [Anaerolineae bacterium]|nr:hypothetical protein [Anaerolineae bacterium]